MMPATIHCVRHAQGVHNLGPQFWNVPDPKLTPLGEEQCLNLKSSWADQSTISLVTASPLSRTLHTAWLAFGDALADGKILAIPDAQEISSLPADHGSDAAILKKICVDQGWSVDLSLIEDGWNVKTSDNRYSSKPEAVMVRARDARRLIRHKVQELEALNEKNPEIVVVTHGGFLHYFTDDWEHSNTYVGTGWQNCETRSYTFGFDYNDSDARLVETMDSRRRRGIDYPMLPKEKQMALFKQCISDWQVQFQ